jgi:hypothetical protein
LGAFANVATAAPVVAVEYYYAAWDHYFMTANPAEEAILDAGTIRGWTRTGQTFLADDSAALWRQPSLIYADDN